MTYLKGKSDPKEEEIEEYGDHSESGWVLLLQKSKLCGFLKDDYHNTNKSSAGVWKSACIPVIVDVINNMFCKHYTYLLFLTKGYRCIWIIHFPKLVIIWHDYTPEVE